MTIQELNQIRAYEEKAKKLLQGIKSRKELIESLTIAKEDKSDLSRVLRAYGNDKSYSKFPSKELFDRSIEFIIILTQEEINKLEKEFESLKLSDFKE